MHLQVSICHPDGRSGICLSVLQQLCMSYSQYYRANYNELTRATLNGRFHEEHTQNGFNSDFGSIPVCPASTDAKAMFRMDM